MSLGGTKLELVPVPVSDVDRAKAFYTEKVGFNVDLRQGPDGFDLLGPVALLC